MRLKKFKIQIRFMAVTMKGIGVKAIQGAPQRAVEHVAAMQGIEFDAGFGDSPALAFRLFALLRGESRKKGLEGIVALVVPMKLAVAAQYQPGMIETRRRCPQWGTARARTTVVRCARSRGRRVSSVCGHGFGVGVGTRAAGAARTPE